ncbi:ABC transporter substrate-binding protein [Mycolicibacterium goodii]|uniref:ABC transporter substrate-binding protein n=1 Tax=Mycolicibacterium goodii TaxID=134601 RepID=UPI001BDBCE25|nr:ABC transporter substrate-binding protein [Mycolicibacterium goodii]MBU8829758.1 ABC transporter substrate-binding protein [Mycolicibacterium goodii]
MAPLLVLILVMTGCGSAHYDDPDQSAGTVTVVAANGEVAVPVTDRGIWALDIYSALNLIAVGVVPGHAARTHPGQEAREQILTDAGVEIVEAHKPELIAGFAPSVIVGVDSPEHRALIGQFEAIAPVVLFEDGIGADAHLELIGTMTGHAQEAAAVIEFTNTAVAELAHRIQDAGHGGKTVSVLQAYPTVFYAYDNSSQLGVLLSRLGLHRPAGQSGGESDWGFIEVAEENLSDHQADVMIALVDDIYSRGQSVLDNPMLETSEAITAQVEFTGWYNDDILSVWWFLHDLEAILLDGAQPASFADVRALWTKAMEGS